MPMPHAIFSLHFCGYCVKVLWRAYRGIPVRGYLFFIASVSITAIGVLRIIINKLIQRNVYF